MKLKDLLMDSNDSSLSSLKWHTLRQSILRSLLSLGDQTIAELSTQLQSSIPTITKAINTLLNEGYVIDLGKIGNSGGRRPSLYSVKPSCAFFLGVEVDRSSVSIGMQNLKNEFVTINLNIPFVLENTETSLNEFCNLINTFIDDSQVNKELIVGVCINLSGRINSIEGFSYNYFFKENTPLTDIISSQVALPVYLENDSRAMAYGEYCEGVVGDQQNVIFLNYNWGVGIGIITNGNLYYGKSGYSGEFGHSSLFDNEKLCQCGKIGCLETEISGWALVDQFKQAIAEGRQSKVNIDSPQGVLAHRLIIDGALKLEDNLCIDLITKQSEKMGRYLSILLNIFNPDLLVVGGEFSKLGDYVLLPIRASLKKHSLGLVNRDMQLKNSILGSKAGVIGACNIVKQKIFSSIL